MALQTWQSWFSMPTMVLRAGGEEYSKYKQQVAEMLKAGQLVVQMLAAEETISMPDGSRKATFTQETWDMVSPHFQAIFLCGSTPPML